MRKTVSFDECKCKKFHDIKKKHIDFPFISYYICRMNCKMMMI